MVALLSGVSIMRRFSLKSLLQEAVSGHQGWERQWRAPEPKAEYDIIIVGGGGHGLATAYYLAKEFGLIDRVIESRDSIEPEAK